MSKEVEKVIFNGFSYSRNPNSKDTNSHYFKGRSGSLHREVYKFYKGKIPKGYHIHHLDADKANNNIENLECLSPTEHKKKHEDIIRVYWKNKPYIEEKCKICGNNYKTRKTHGDKICSGKCRNKKQYESEVYKEKRICIICGNQFRCMRFTSSKTCSAKCACKTRVISKKPPNRKCPNCSCEFRARRIRSVYCGKKCQLEYREKNRLKKLLIVAR